MKNDDQYTKKKLLKFDEMHGAKLPTLNGLIVQPNPSIVAQKLQEMGNFLQN
jgi:hypothetical protein